MVHFLFVNQLLFIGTTELLLIDGRRTTRKEFSNGRWKIKAKI